jgi:hypothetical protein
MDLYHNEFGSARDFFGGKSLTQRREDAKTQRKKLKAES